MIPLETLQRPLGMADPHASKIAIAQCENELASITNEFDFLYNLKETIRDKISKVPSLESVADNFFVSSRTLKRRLKEEGTTYQKLVDDIRLEESKKLMCNPDLSLQHIAERVGYQDPANFTRAFKKWTGDPPSIYRENLFKTSKALSR
ncbi:AraC family transcriptional regulator [Oleiphilus messinensis]|uniref:AraC family transcriptional regulator n=1 Tax=Oleiphilus messinensis TaxID=141451 RepID=A0A1Y0IHN5_9GAMM|nr:AraC family transcriptional regulator [Oleiphilus messinensis]ARU58933.1 AraC family transcriptional regulator [Oleiphilus messinensis]